MFFLPNVVTPINTISNLLKVECVHSKSLASYYSDTLDVPTVGSVTMICCKFIVESNSLKKFKMGWQLPKLCLRTELHVFFDSQCRWRYLHTIYVFFLTRSVDEDICTQFRTKVQHGADCGQLQDSFQPTIYSRAWRRVQLLVYLYFICICLYSVTKIV